MKKQTFRAIQTEIKQYRKSHIEKFGKRIIRKSLPMLFSAQEIESMLRIEWLEGYAEALRDERGKK
jgi:hypothetical protein